ncbi:MAG: anthranilate phosphoribosyltransferase [Oscillospiraceae bacterium]|nr:anthranilate phosphoribosyltransferase [Oscillospiraceae bacterium]
MHIAAAIKSIIDGNNLTEEQCYDAIYEVMSGEATDAQIAGLLIALRVKGETVEEITGGARALAERANRIAPKVPLCVDPVGTGGDGTNTFNISSTAAIVAAAGGAFVAKHGNRCISSRSGSADFYEAIGINIALTPAAVEKCIEEVGFGFMFAPNFHPAMRFAGPVRRQLAVRNIFNILGPLSNPAGAKAQVLGVYDRKIMDYIAKTLQCLGEQHSLVVHGSDGSDEITNTGVTYICEVRPDSIEEYTITPEQFGMTRVTLDDIRGGTPEENTGISMDVFRGKKGPHRDIVVLNAAATLYVAGMAPTLEEAVRLAGDTLDSGKALAKLEEIQNFTHREDIVNM